MMAIGARARAALMGRNYVLPDDVKALAIPTLAHRVVLSPLAEIEGRSIQNIIGNLVEQVAAPR
jgi:MoxR-like ATPase